MTLLPWLAHLYTAAGTGVALAATLAILAGDFRSAFLWLALAVVIDTTDGVLARALRVGERLPSFDGARLDDIVDYLTYVFVPVLLILRADLMPPAAEVPVGVAVLLASAYGFSRTDAKVVAGGEYFFTGFPSYWNIVAFYLYVLALPRTWAAAVLVLLAVLVFVPVRYVYPSRTRAMRGVTIALGCAWGAVLLLMLLRLPVTSGPWAIVSLMFPVYYTALSLWLTTRARA